MHNLQPRYEKCAQFYLTDETSERDIEHKNVCTPVEDHQQLSKLREDRDQDVRWYTKQTRRLQLFLGFR
jgi:hypothetical protein